MSDASLTTPSAEAISAAAHVAQRAGRGLPPVHLWNPPFCGDLDIRIARDGTWFYLGSPIRRPELVRLFAGILRREGDAYFLVTPVEKVGITVDDTPFIAVDVAVTGAGAAQLLRFETNVGDQVTAGPDHPIRVAHDPRTDEPSPYVMVRAGLEALIDRKTFYRLVEIGQHHDGWFGLWSGGEFWRIIPESDLPGD